MTYHPEPLKQRQRVAGRIAEAIAADADDLVHDLRSDIRRDDAESLTAEIIPLCAALKHLSRHAESILRPRRVGWRGRPPWLWNIRQTVSRVPHGDVLILGTWNYPLFLTASQAAGSFVAGNRTIIKPAPGTTNVLRRWIDLAVHCGCPPDAFKLLGETVADATAAIDDRPDLVVMTGSATTAKAVLKRCADALIPTIIEASGCDAMVVLPGADLEHAAKLFRFGWKLNSGATCIAPRRLMVPRQDANRFRDILLELCKDDPPLSVHPAARDSAASILRAAVAEGGELWTGRLPPIDDDWKTLTPTLVQCSTAANPILSADVFAPLSGVLIYDDVDAVAELVNDCPYALAASVIGPADQARNIAKRLVVGTVVINDIVLPTADPRVPFGGRRMSGFGVTRGDEGLRQMTAVRVIAEQRSRLCPHLWPRKSSDAELFQGLLTSLYARGGRRISGMAKVVRAGRQSMDENPAS